jgi:hypothetical protein
MFVWSVLHALANDVQYKTAFDEHFDAEHLAAAHDKRSEIARKNVILSQHLKNYDSDFAGTPVEKYYREFKYGFFRTQGWQEVKGEIRVHVLFQKYFDYSGLVKVDSFDKIANWGETDITAEGMFQKLRTLNINDTHQDFKYYLMELFLMHLVQDTEVKHLPQMRRAFEVIPLYYKLMFTKETADFLPTFIARIMTTAAAYARAVDVFKQSTERMLAGICKKTRENFMDVCHLYAIDQMKPDVTLGESSFELLPYVKDAWYDGTANHCFHAMVPAIKALGSNINLQEVTLYFVGNALKLYNFSDQTKYQTLLGFPNDVTNIGKIAHLYRMVFMEMSHFLSDHAKSNPYDAMDCGLLMQNLDAYKETLKPWYEMIYQMNSMHFEPQESMFYMSDGLAFYAPAANAQDTLKASDIVSDFATNPDMKVDYNSSIAVNKYCLHVARMAASHSKNVEYTNATWSLIQMFDLGITKTQNVREEIKVIEKFMRAELMNMKTLMRVKSTFAQKTKIVAALELLLRENANWISDTMQVEDISGGVGDLAEQQSADASSRA